MVRWSKLINLSENSTIKRHNRLFSNWYRARKILESSNAPFALHRIGSKRVVFELLQQADSKRTKRKTHLKWLSLAVVVPLLTAFVLLVGGFDAPDDQTARAPSVSNRVCVSLAGLKSEEVKDIAKFELAGWQIVTFGEKQTIGDLSAISFEATCDELIASGELTFAKSESGVTILGIAPI